jgi:hypothetical protein
MQGYQGRQDRFAAIPQGSERPYLVLSDEA